MTILRGRMVMRDGESTGTPGDGRFVSPGSREEGSSEKYRTRGLWRPAIRAVPR